MTVPPLDVDAAGRLPVAAGHGPSLAPDVQGRAREPARWVLQADAAKLAGCSVSAIRKWRREGSVASRKITTPAGLERVEVPLDDVLRRAGPREMRLPDPRGAGGLASTVAGTVLVPVDDFQALLERVAVAEQLAGGLEARLRAIDAEACRMREQFVALRRQMEQERNRGARSGVPGPDGAAERPEATLSRPGPPDPVPGQPPGTVRDSDGVVGDRPAPQPTRPPVAQPPPAARPPLDPADPPATPPPSAPQATPPPATQSPPATSPPRPPPPPSARAAARPSPETRPAPLPERAPGPESPTFRQWLGARRPPETQRAPAYDLERLGGELHRLFGRLQARQRQGEVSPADAERWVADLAAYDSGLLRACRVLGVPAPYRVGERIPASDRVALTRALAAAGLDVRRGAPPPNLTDLT